MVRASKPLRYLAPAFAGFLLTYSFSPYDLSLDTTAGYANPFAAFASRSIPCSLVRLNDFL